MTENIKFTEGWHLIDGQYKWWTGEEWDVLESGWYLVFDKSQYWDGEDWYRPEESGFYEIDDEYFFWDKNEWLEPEEIGNYTIEGNLYYWDGNSWFIPEDSENPKINNFNQEVDYQQSSKELNDEVEWTEEQNKIITSPKVHRLLIDAGPGTGKTATACSRIAHLLEKEGVAPNEILICSFTNAAVIEFRNRIRSFLKNSNLASGLRITTLDSFAWNLRNGFKQSEIKMSSFQDNIEKTFEMVQSDSEIEEFLQDFQHFVVDEAQDITGIRSELIINIFEKLPENCGISVFSDDAQAIYGFNEDDELNYSGDTLPEKIFKHKLFSRQFNKIILSKIHRTKDNQLLKIFSSGRDFILESNDNSSPASTYTNVRNLILQNSNDFANNQSDSMSGLERPDRFLLFRRRIDALQSSQNMKLNPRRLRLSGYGNSIQSWVARIFWDFENEKMNEDEFMSLCAKRLDNEYSFVDLWHLLMREVGTDKKRINIRELSRLLSRNNIPTGFAITEYGFGGPIIGTVHASKGREADEVLFYLPREPSKSTLSNEDSYEKVLEEARILFVGATRARKSLVVKDLDLGERYYHSGVIGLSGRAYSIKNNKSARIAFELGRNGDIDSQGVTGRETFENAGEVILAQKVLWNHRYETLPLIASSSRDSNWKFESKIDFKNLDLDVESRKHESKLFDLSNSVNADLFYVGKNVLKQNLKPPTELRDFFMLGARTIALSPDNINRESLHEPWQNTGFMLAPLITGFPELFLERYSRRRF